MSNKLIKNGNGEHGKKGIVNLLYNKVKRVTDIAICIYMLIIIVILPLYNPQGYLYIGSYKIRLYKNVVMVFLPLTAIFLACLFLYIIVYKKNSFIKYVKFLKERINIIDIFALLYLVVVVTSFLCSDYTEQALWGANGWGMGTLPQITFAVSYFLIAHVWKKRNWIVGMFFPISAILFSLGFLNRFGVYLFEMKGATPEFISTIGNINWYCGYMVSIFFGFVFLVWSDYFKGWKLVLLYLYLIIGFASLITQGSSSGVFTLVGILFIFFLLSLKDGRKMQIYLSIILMLSISCIIILFIRLLFPEAITYEETVTNILTNSLVPFFIIVIIGLLFALVKTLNHKNKYPTRLIYLMGSTLGIITLVLLVGYFILLVINTNFPDSIHFLNGYNFFTFSPEWGSLRGATWTAGILIFLEQGVLKKLIGVGPDCMSAYINSETCSEINEFVLKHFNGDRLTNAHNELLTLLVNVGLIGLISFLGIMVSAIVGYISSSIKKRNAFYFIIGACGICLLAYCINNFFSFQQINNTPTIFVILGIGRTYIKENYHNQ